MAYIKKKKKQHRYYQQISEPLYTCPFSNIIKNKQGAKSMYDILNINEGIPTAQQTWNKFYNIQEKD